MKDEIAHCDRPDRAIRLAFHATRDRKAVVRIAIDIARFISRPSDLAFLIPWPTRFEALDRWGDNEDEVSRSFATARAIIIATIVAIPLAYVTDRVATHDWFTDHGLPLDSLYLLFLVLAFALAAALRMSIAWVVRRRASRLTERSALDAALTLISIGSAKKPRRAVRALRFLHHLSDLVDESVNPTPPSPSEADPEPGDPRMNDPQGANMC